MAGRRKQGIDLRTVQKVDQSAGVTLSRYSQYALDLSDTRRFFVSGIVKESADGCQTQIAAAGRNSTTLFQVIQKCGNQRDIDLFKSYLGRRLVETLLGEMQEQAKRIPIGSDVMRTRLPLTHQPLREEVLQQWGQCG